MNSKIYMGNALVGATGFVGTTLRKQTCFSAFYNSRNIADISDNEFDTVVCAAAPAQKWIANKNPAQDYENMCALIGNLKSVKCNNFILISTVDVFKSPIEVDESCRVDELGLHAYGLHRRFLEKFVQENFEKSLIVRLPGLVGPGLRKNIIYDFLHNNNITSIDSRSVFQFYPMVNLWSDIETALKASLSLIHLTSVPISVEEVARYAFGIDFENQCNSPPSKYDFRSKFASIFGTDDLYQYSKKEVLLAIRAYAQSELSNAKEPQL